MVVSVNRWLSLNVIGNIKKNRINSDKNFIMRRNGVCKMHHGKIEIRTDRDLPIIGVISNKVIVRGKAIMNRQVVTISKIKSHNFKDKLSENLINTMPINNRISHNVFFCDKNAIIKILNMN